MARFIAITGSAPETRDAVNALSDDVEIWGMNATHTWLKRYDRYFQIHPFEWGGKGYFGRDLDHWNFLVTCPVPVYMRFPEPVIVNALRYPLEEVCDDIGRQYLTSTPAHAIALAIHEAVDEIGLYGIMLDSRGEYVEERPCIEYLLGVAEGRGIKVVIPDEAPVLKGPLYPLGRTETFVAHARLRNMKDAYMRLWAQRAALEGKYELAHEQGDFKRVAQFTDLLDETTRRLTETEGKLAELKYWASRNGAVDLYAPSLPLYDLPLKKSVYA